ncbi:MAG TPA: alkaline shock response membrane anchor protein AmaP [Chloroflexi bacterium]|jgi:hypothetical protein|nr:alkaline shock response membrane anchor protein AmaP [Chloroflexota bacterium]
MRIFNRIIVTLGIVLLLALILLFLLVPIQTITAVRAGLDTFERYLFVDQFYYIFLGVLAVSALILLWLLYMELRRPRRRTVRIKSQEGGTAQLGVESIAQSLEYRIDELAGVRRVSSDIVSRGKDVDVIVNLDTSPSVNIPVLTDEIVRLSRDIVEGQLGVRIHGNVLVNVTHEPYPRGTMPPTGPLGEEPVIPPRGAEPPPAPARRGLDPSASSSAIEFEPIEQHPTPPPEVEPPDYEPIDYPPLLDEETDEDQPPRRHEENAESV